MTNQRLCPAPSVATFVDRQRLFSMGLVGLLLLLAGCGVGLSMPAPLTVSASVSGVFHGGQQPVSGSSIQLYAISTSGNGSVSQALLSQPVTTNRNGEFSLPAEYICPSANSVVYLTARGGNPGLTAGIKNASIGAMAVLGTCGSIGPGTFVNMNEITTIGSIWPLASFANGYSSLGYGSASATEFNSAVATISELTNIALGTAPGAALPAGATAPLARLNTLASILAACINSAGGTAGDGSVCGTLFQYATMPGGAAPANTLDALFAIAATPAQHVDGLFELLPPVVAFEPTLQSAPADWTLPVVTAPVISPAPGVYAASVTASLATGTNGAVIHYTTDGTKPTSSSAIYTAPITLSQSATVNALTLADNITSSIVSASYTVAPPVSVALTPAAVSLQQSQDQSFTAAVSNSSSEAVTWSLEPSVGTVTSAGVYTAPASIVSDQTVTITATSVADPTKSASAAISLIPPTPTKLVFLSSPALTSAGSLLSPTVAVAIEDGEGNVVNSASNSVLLSLGSDSAGETLAGTLTQTAVQGVATFSGLTINTAAIGYRLQATSSGLLSATSPVFDVSPASLPLISSRVADDFVNSVGLNVHFSYYGSIYTTLSSELIQDIGKLGVRHLRDQMAWEGTAVSASPFYTIHNQLGLTGVKTDYILTSINYPTSQVAVYPTLVNDMEAAEPANEYDASGDPNWVSAITAQEASLFQQMQSSSRTSRMTVVSPSLAQPAYASQLGDMSGISDAGNSHAYFAGWNPGNSGTGGANNPAYFMNLAEVNNPGQPVWVSETGFWSVPGPYYGGYGISETAQALYEPRVLLNFWNAGAGRTYIYELADWNNAIDFGLLREDGSAKPSFGAIQNLLGTLSDKGSAFTPASLACSITGGNPQVQYALFQKRDGSFYLAIWLEAESYNFLTQKQLTVPAQTVNLQVGRAVLSATTYQLNSAGTMTTTALTPNQTLKLSVTDSVQIIKLALQ